MPYHNSPTMHQIKALKATIAKQYKDGRKQLARQLAPQRIQLLELRLQREQEIKEALGAPNTDNIARYKNEIRLQKKLL